MNLNRVTLTVFGSLTLLLLSAGDAEAQVLKKGRVYNDSDVEVVVKIVGITQQQHVRQEVDIAQKSAIFPLSQGDRMVIAWDSFNETIIASDRVNVSANLRVKVVGDATNGYQIVFAAVAANADP